MTVNVYIQVSQRCLKLVSVSKFRFHGLGKEKESSKNFFAQCQIDFSRKAFTFQLVFCKAAYCCGLMEVLYQVKGFVPSKYVFSSKVNSF